MKHNSIVIIILIIATCAFSQDFKPIQKNNMPFFYANEASILGIKVDFAQEVEGDSVFHFYKTWEKSGEWCYSPTGPSWAGRKAVEKANGDFLFFNFQGDTITIKPHSENDEEWIFYKFPEGNKIIATVETMQEEEFIDVQDMVKTIGLVLVNEYEEPIDENPYEDLKIKLSENFGFIKLFPFRDFNSSASDFFLPPPLPIVNWYIDGMTNPEIGKSLLTDAHIYNFDIGDEFHRASSYLLNYFSETKIITKVTDKEQNETTGEIIYHKDNIKHFVVIDNNNPENNIDTIYTFVSTFVVNTYNPTAYFPEEVIINEDSLFGFFGNRQTYWLFDRMITNPIDAYFFTNLGDDCWALGTLDKKIYEKGSLGFVEGLGSLGHSFAWAVGDDERNLVYYKKQNAETWGTPLVINSTQIIGSNSFKIYPNPVAKGGYLTVSAPEQLRDYSVTLVNSVGKSMAHWNSKAEYTRLKFPDNITTGLYILLIRSDQGVISSKVVVE